MTYIEKLKELKQSAPTSWPETTRLLFCRICTSCWAKRKIRQHRISEPKVCAANLWSEKHSDFFHNQPTPRSEIHSYFFYKLIYIIYRWIIKRKTADWKILIFISGGAQIRRHICIVDLYRWLNENNKNRNNKAIVLSDMLSDSIKYQDLWSEKHSDLSLLLNTFLLNSNY